MLFTSIPRLFLPRSPAAIAGLIVAIIVDAIKSSSGRTFAHISEKVLKAVFPPVADGDAASTISMKTPERGPRAALLHGLPRQVFWRLESIVCGRSVCLDRAAPAPSGFARQKISCLRGCDLRAIASANPVPFFSSLWPPSQNQQFAESSANEIFRFHRVCIIA